MLFSPIGIRANLGKCYARGHDPVGNPMSEAQAQGGLTVALNHSYCGSTQLMTGKAQDALLQWLYTKF